MRLIFTNNAIECKHVILQRIFWSKGPHDVFDCKNNGEEIFHPSNRAIVLNFNNEHDTGPKNQDHNNRIHLFFQLLKVCKKNKPLFFYLLKFVKNKYLFFQFSFLKFVKKQNPCFLKFTKNKMLDFSAFANLQKKINFCFFGFLEFVKNKLLDFSAFKIFKS